MSTWLVCGGLPFFGILGLDGVDPVDATWLIVVEVDSIVDPVDATWLIVVEVDSIV